MPRLYPHRPHECASFVRWLRARSSISANRPNCRNPCARRSLAPMRGILLSGRSRARRETKGRGMKINRTALTVTAVVGAATAAIATGATGVGASTGYSFVGWAGGSLVRAANNTITSDLTAASSINYEDPASDTNDAASVQIPDLLNAGVVKTSAVSSEIANGYKVVSTAETTGISALGGLIKADAVKTVSTATVVNGVASASVASTFVNLKVGSVNVPVNVKPNTIIRIPNVATVALNYQLDFAKGNSSFNIGIGAYVSLLKPRGENAIGAELSLSPT